MVEQYLPSFPISSMPNKAEELVKILVIGATGPSGNQIISLGHSLGYEMTVFARSLENLNFPNTTKYAQGDVMNPDSLRAAIRGQHAVISALGTRKLGATTLLSEGTRNIIHSMMVEGVDRFVCITGIGAGDSLGHGGFLYDYVIQPLLLKEMYIDKNRQEILIHSSGLNWTIVRPAKLTNGKRTKTYRELYSLEGIKTSKISRADVADSIFKNIRDPETYQKTYNITY